MDFKDDYQQKKDSTSINQNQEQNTSLGGYINDQSEQGSKEAVWAAKIQSGNQQPNKTGIPDDLKAKLERESGFDLSKVRVHYNSEKPTEIGAYAYAEGYNVYLAQGQEDSLEHELRHVIQQLKGEAKGTKEIAGKKVDTRQSMEDDANKEKTPQNTTNQDLTTATPKPVVQGNFWSDLWDAFEEFTYQIHPQLRDDFYDDDSTTDDQVVVLDAPSESATKPRRRRRRRGKPQASASQITIVESKDEETDTDDEASDIDDELFTQVGDSLKYLQSIPEREKQDKWGEDYDNALETIEQAQGDVLKKNAQNLDKYAEILSDLTDALFTPVSKDPKQYLVSELENRVTTPGVGLKMMLRDLNKRGEIKPGVVNSTYVSSYDKNVGEFSVALSIKDSSSSNIDVVIHAHVAADGRIKQAHLKPTSDEFGLGYSLNSLPDTYFKTYITDALAARYGANWTTSSSITRKT